MIWFGTELFRLLGIDLFRCGACEVFWKYLGCSRVSVLQRLNACIAGITYGRTPVYYMRGIMACVRNIGPSLNLTIL